eukprot:c53401_g1_i1 orf=273-875(+)
MGHLRYYIGLLLIHLLHGHFFPSSADDGANSQLLNDINQYRTQVVGISALSSNTGASCMAEKVLTKFKGTACTNSTGVDTVLGQEQQFPEYPDWVSTCKLAVESTHDGQILPECVPGNDLSQSAKVASYNYTHSQDSEYINDTKYTSAGVASVDNWFVLILATNASTGDYQQTGGAQCKHIPLLSAVISNVGMLLFAFVL